MRMPLIKDIAKLHNLLEMLKFPLEPHFATLVFTVYRGI